MFQAMFLRVVHHGSPWKGVDMAQPCELPQVEKHPYSFFDSAFEQRGEA